MLIQSSILVLPRPSSKQGEGGFPTKLGEYLATSNPVITTTVGEIPLYLKDNVNAFLIEPDNLTALVDKICFIINNPDFAKEVAKNGCETAKENFDGIKRSFEILETLIKEFN